MDKADPKASSPAGINRNCTVYGRIATICLSTPALSCIILMEYLCLPDPKFCPVCGLFRGSLL